MRGTAASATRCRKAQAVLLFGDELPGKAWWLNGLQRLVFGRAQDGRRFTRNGCRLLGVFYTTASCSQFHKEAKMVRTLLVTAALSGLMTSAILSQSKTGTAAGDSPKFV